MSRYSGMLVGLSVTLLALQGCGDKKKDAPGKKSADKAVASTKASATTAAAKFKEAAPQRKARVERVRDILRRSLNATAARHVSRLEKASLYDLTVDLAGDGKSYKATETLHFTNKTTSTLKELFFFVYPNSAGLAKPGQPNLLVDSATVNGEVVQTTLRDTTLRIKLPTPLGPGAEAKVHLAFHAKLVVLKDGASDIWKMAMKQLVEMVMGGESREGGYGIFSVGDSIVSLGLWYPILAAHDNGQWDIKQAAKMGDVSYFNVANYDVTLTAPSDMAVATTGVEVKRSIKGDRSTSRFVAGGVREFTLQMSKDYVHKATIVDGVKVNSWYVRQHARAGGSVLETTRKSLKLFNRLFGPYPYSELDIVEAPLVGGAGGVEFPGLVTIAKMFYGADSSGGLTGLLNKLMEGNPYMRDTLEFVVAHEVAHQWWNAVVGSDSKRHPFVDEALANHSAVLYFENVHGKEAAEAQENLQLRLSYQIARMAGAKDRPVDLPTDQYNSTLEYAAIVYGKGALFFRKLREQIGVKAHDAFMQSYYKRFAFRIASPEDLIGGLVKGSPTPHKTQQLADRWLKQTHGDEDIGKLKLSKLFAQLTGGDIGTGPMANLFKLLDDEGVAEIGKLVRNLFESDDTAKQDVDYGSIVRLVMKLTGDGDKSDPLVELATRLLGKGKNPLDVLKSGGPNDPLKDVKRNLLKKAVKGLISDGDPKTDALIDAADSLLKALDM